MQEDFLHYIWKFQYFKLHQLRTKCEQELTVLKQGNHQFNSGPDFEQARIKIGEIEWNGSVEIHVRSSEWYQHKHHLDEAYKNVILHVVWTDDKPARNAKGEIIPTLELKDRVNLDLIKRYKQLISQNSPLACEPHRLEISDLKYYEMIDKAVGARLLEKSKWITTYYNANGKDWEETAYVSLCRNFGFKVNSEPFIELATSLPFKIIKKHADQLFQIEALLFGQAGFLMEEKGDDYYGKLRKEYQFLAHKYGLKQSLNRFQWKFLRLRPANFPTTRIAQLAHFLSSTPNLFDVLTSRNVTTKEVVKRFVAFQSPYWQEHFDFGKTYQAVSKGMGRSSAENLVINTVVPLLMSYSRHTDEQYFADKSMNLLEDLKAENNKITRIWKAAGFPVKSALDSQGLIMQYNNWCVARKCLGCNIGSDLLNRSL